MGSPATHPATDPAAARASREMWLSGLPMMSPTTTRVNGGLPLLFRGGMPHGLTLLKYPLGLRTGGGQVDQLVHPAVDMRLERS